jgi:hypothetical protein
VLLALAVGKLRPHTEPLRPQWFYTAGVLSREILPARATGDFRPEAGYNAFQVEQSRQERRLVLWVASASAL